MLLILIEFCVRRCKDTCTHLFVLLPHHKQKKAILRALRSQTLVLSTPGVTTRIPKRGTTMMAKLMLMAKSRVT